MDYKYWLLFLLTIFGVYLTHRQVRFMEAQPGVRPLPPVSWFQKAMRYWPMAVMALLMLGSWIPYFIERPPVDYFDAWGFNGRIYAHIKTEDLVSKRPERLMMIVRAVDNSINEKTDTHIARSATFEIEDKITAIEVVPPPDFVAVNRGVFDIYILLVDKDFPVESVTNLQTAERLGGKIIGEKAFSGRQ